MRLTRYLADAQKPEKGYRTVWQWAARENVSESHMSQIIRRLVRDGKMNVKKFRVRRVNGVRSVPHYALRVQASARGSK